MNHIDESVFIAEGAVLNGDITIGKDSGIWFNAVLRGDFTDIEIGERTNIQDLVMVHASMGHPVRIGNDVTVGHSALIHGCTIDDGTLVGMGAIVMNGCRIGKGCIIGAGSLLTQGTVVPDGSLVLGSPAKVVGPVEGKNRDLPVLAARAYVERAKEEKARQAREAEARQKRRSGEEPKTILL